MKTKLASDVDSTKARRLVDRNLEFLRAKTLHESISRRSGSFSIGKDESGHQKQTRNISSFPIIIDRWYVRMGFKYEDKEMIKSETVAEVENRLKNRGIPRRLIKFDTHIIPAVRVLKHVRQSYQKELSDTDALLRTLDEANLKLASKSKHQKDIQQAIEILKSAELILSKKEVAVKRVVAKERVKSAIDKLENSLKMPEGKRDMEVSRACAVFVSIRNRLGSWRDKQIAGLVEYNLQKECALRVERDRWLFSQFSRFEESIESVYKFSKMDLEKIAVLNQIRKMIAKKEKKENILRFVEEKHELFRVSSRQRLHAEQMISLAESGIQPRTGLNIDYSIGHYAMLYRDIKNGEKSKAIQKIEYLKLFVNANKPSFIFDELSKDPDLYLGPVLEQLDLALASFEAGDLLKAREHFHKAKNAISR